MTSAATKTAFPPSGSRSTQKSGPSHRTSSAGAHPKSSQNFARPSRQLGSAGGLTFECGRRESIRPGEDRRAMALHDDLLDLAIRLVGPAPLAPAPAPAGAPTAPAGF